MSEQPRVLVVDDEPQIQRALRIILRDAGFDVLQAGSVEEALDAAALRPPAAAIVDLVLPDGDGIEITKSLRTWSKMPIIVLSAVGEEEEKVRALEAGADDYVTKPFGPRELVARLQAALRRAEPGASEPVIAAAGGRSAAASSASSTLVACSTSKPASRRMICSARRICGSSSTTRTRGCSFIGG